MKKKEQEEYIDWHAGFRAIVPKEFREDIHALDIETEYLLNKGSLRIDCLMVHKLHEIPMQNEIGHFFRKYNIVEYKGPEAGLNQKLMEQLRTLGKEENPYPGIYYYRSLENLFPFQLVVGSKLDENNHLFLYSRPKNFIQFKLFRGIYRNTKNLPLVNPKCF